MPIEATIIADSINPDGNRLTSWKLTFPRVVLAELNTHRVFSRNSASSRAIPTERIIQAVLDDPYIPQWTQNQKGMQGQTMEDDAARQATHEWLKMRDIAVQFARALHGINVHKQDVNRLLEPWMFTTVILSGTEFENFFLQRASPHAHPAFGRLAYMMKEKYEANRPNLIDWGGWHLPLISRDDEHHVLNDYHLSDDGAMDVLVKMSTARCARISYLRESEVKPVSEDIARHDDLVKSLHWSPLEHPAKAERGQHGNFTGWKQHRQEYPHESGVMAKALDAALKHGLSVM